ncbi:MAG: hypothetical protein OXG54_10885 [Gammaproteobacteria bacterium]|nr:hypothetical protein [Gammaproteobacteria bacterium]
MVVPASFHERWGLFSLLVFIASIVVAGCWFITDLFGEQEYRHMIRVSVRCSLPLLLMAFAASALKRLWPGEASAWLVRNRKYVGLAFSAVMLWQILFIVLLVSTGAPLFPPGPAALFIVSDLIGYTLLLSMTITSFEVFRQRMSPVAWKRLHRTGIYYIWVIYLYSFPIGIYFSRHDNLEIAGYGFLFLVTLAAGLLRLLAWGKDRKIMFNKLASNIVKATE